MHRKLDSRFFPEIESEIVSSEQARVYGLALYDMGAYPAAVYSDETVIGDLLTVTSEAVATMDRIEGHPDFYQRVKVRALCISETVHAWMYCAPEALIVGYPRIRSGDWFDREDLEEPDPKAPLVLRPAEAALVTLVRSLANESYCWLGSVGESLVNLQTSQQIWLNGRLFLFSSSDTPIHNNIKTNAAVVVAHPDSDSVTLLEAIAMPFGEPTGELKSSYRQKYGVASPLEYPVIEAAPRRLQAWGGAVEGDWSAGEIMRVQAI